MLLSIRRLLRFLTLRRLVIFAVAPILVLVGLSFARLAAEQYQLNAQKSQLQRQIQQLQEENQRLQAEASYLETDAAVEQLAREELGWTKPGETAVIVVWDDHAAPPRDARHPTVSTR